MYAEICAFTQTSEILPNDLDFKRWKGKDESEMPQIGFYQDRGEKTFEI